MKKTFQGRVIIAGNCEGEAVVSRSGFNILASLAKPSLQNIRGIRSRDQNNPEIFNQLITGKILCLPETIGSTGGGLILHSAAKLNLAPKAMLFSEHIDPLAAAGVIMADVWDEKPIITVDGLGPDFLGNIRTGDTIRISDTGVVEIL